jgi:methyl-accepting chemotaxis protein
MPYIVDTAVIHSYNYYMHNDQVHIKLEGNIMNSNTNFEDLVRAIQTIAYGEGKYMNDNIRDNMDSIAISLYQLSEQTERIAGALEELVDSYNKVNASIFKRHPGTDMTKKVQQALDKMNN